MRSPASLKRNQVTTPIAATPVGGGGSQSFDITVGRCRDHDESVAFAGSTNLPGNVLVQEAQRCGRSEMDQQAAALKIGKHTAADITELVILPNPFAITAWFPHAIATASKYTDRILDRGSGDDLLADRLNSLIDSPGGRRSSSQI